MNAFLNEERLARSLARASHHVQQQLSRLRKHGVGEAEERPVRYSFQTNSQAKADSLALVLQQRGYSTKVGTTHWANIKKPWTAGWLDMPTWTLSGECAPLQMQQQCLVAWAESLCQLGAAYDCEFTGWHVETPDFLAFNDDYSLNVCPYEGTLHMSIFRWNAASEAALAENDVFWVRPHAEMGSLQHLAPYAAKIRGLKSPSESLDLREIELLTGLELIHLPHAYAHHGDYRKLPQLRHFTCLDAENLKPELLDNPSLRRLTLHQPKKLKGLQGREAWQALETLIIRRPPWTSLDGLAALSSLRELRVAQSRSLIDVSGLAQAGGLELLELIDLPKAQGFEAMAALKELRWVFVLAKHARLSSTRLIERWPHVLNAFLGLGFEDVDLRCLGAHPSLANLLMYTHEGYALPTEAELKAEVEQGGRRFRSAALRPKDELPSIEITLESPYWRLPKVPQGHGQSIAT